jgi:chemotaxis protein CheX
MGNGSTSPALAGWRGDGCRRAGAADGNDDASQFCKDLHLDPRAKMKYSPIRVEYINPFVESTRAVFATMLRFEVRRGEISLKRALQPEHEISGIIGLSGAAKGTVVISMSASLAIEITSIFVGERSVTINADVIDAIGELTNMIVGSAKAKLDDLKMSIGLPTVIVGRNHAVAFPSGVTPLSIPFESMHGAFCLEVGLATTS